MRSVEFKLTIEDADVGRVRAEMDGGTSRFQGTVDKLYLDTIDIFEDWLSQEGKVSQRKELEVLGTHLYKVLFNGEVNTFFEEALNRVDKEGERLVVQLSFEGGGSKLETLPWEYLYYPETELRRGFFLATKMDLYLSRYIPFGRGRQNLVPEESSLRILIVVSNPEAEELGFGPMVAEPIIEAIQKLEERYSITFTRIEKPTIEQFSDKLEEVKPHVLHFFGHGRYNRGVSYGRYDREEGRAEIALLGRDERSVVWLNDKRFTDCITRAHPVPRLVFLHLFESTKNDFNANFDRLAPDLIRANIQAVVAMRYPIASTAATIFSRAFYNKLAEGEPVDAAVQEGRYRIIAKDDKAYNSRVFGTPVLYMQSREVIFQPKRETASKAAKVSPNIGNVVNISSGSPTKQDIEPKVEPIQIVPVVNADANGNVLPPSTIEQDQGSYFPPPLGDANKGKGDISRLVETIVAKGRETIKGKTDLSIGQKVQKYKKLKTISNELSGKSSDEIINILLRCREEADDEFDLAIIDSMLDILGAMYE